MNQMARIAATAACVSFGIACGTAFADCEQCGASKKKCCLFNLPDPPRADAAFAVPAALTNQRATRQATAPQAAPVPPTPAACTDDSTEKQIEMLNREMRILKEQLRVLATLLEEKHGAPASPMKK